MRSIHVLHLEDVITSRMRQQRREISRIGIKHGPQGWRCEQVWFAKGSAELSESQAMAVLAEADIILAELLRGHEVVKSRRARREVSATN